MLALLALPALAVDIYPLTDPELLAMRRLETEALYLAVRKSGRARARYARTAVVAHDKRMVRIGPALADAERAVEREGIHRGEQMARSYAAGDARRRAVAAGSTMAILLDDLAPGWRSDDRPLDVLLDEATQGQRIISMYDDISTAREDVRALRQAQQMAETDYLTQSGYGIRIVLPMDVTQTDPFAAIGLDDGVRLYPEQVELSSEWGTLSVSGPGAYVSREEVRVVGLAFDDLSMDHQGDWLLVEGPGLELRLTGAVYRGAPNEMTVDIVPGASMAPDPSVFALFALATAAGFEGARSDLRDRMQAAGASCPREVEAFQAPEALEVPSLDAMLASTVLLGPPPRFLPDLDPSEIPVAQRDDRLGGLPGQLEAFWRCADLETVWDEVKDDWVLQGQQALATAAPDLFQANKIDPLRWPHVRIVPNLLDGKSQASSASWGNEVTVFLGPPPGKRTGYDPGAVVHEAFHHVVDPLVLGRPCPAFEAVHATVLGKEAVAETAAEPDVWLAESIVRALAVEAGTLLRDEDPDAAVQSWVDEGFPLVRGILVGLERQSWDVWIEEQCGESEWSGPLP